MHVLVVEDSPRVATVLENGLRVAGHRVSTAPTKAGALERTNDTSIDLAIIDVGLPDGSGLDLCAQLRRDGFAFPVIILTARDDVGDRVRGLDAGADDYIGKPFAMVELLARVRALGRRGPRWTESTRRYGDIVIDRDRRSVERGGRLLPLTPRELDVVSLLAWRDGRVVPRDELLEMIWGTSSSREAASLEVLVSRIRRKFDSDVIRTIRGTGYAWALARSKQI